MIVVWEAASNNPISREEGHVFTWIDETAHEGNISCKVWTRVLVIIITLLQGYAVDLDSNGEVIDGYGWDLQYPIFEFDN